MSLPIAFWAASGVIVISILAGIATIYYGLKVRKAISGKPNQGQLH